LSVNKTTSTVISAINKMIRDSGFKTFNIFLTHGDVSRSIEAFFSSSAGMIGTLVAAEIPGLDPTQYLQTWKSAVDKLNNLVVPTITPSSIVF
jgi:hypothetical protein